MITIDPEVAERKLNSDLNILNDPRIQVKTIGRGNHGNGSRGEGENLKLSTPMKALIGSMAKMNGHGGSKKIAEAFGMNHNVVNNYKNGKVATSHGVAVPKEELKSLIEKNVDKVREMAIDRLMEAMGVITPEKMEKLGANSAADLGLKMASIHEKLGPKGNNGAVANAQIVIMAPRVREEKEYLTREVEPVRD